MIEILLAVFFGMFVQWGFTALFSRPLCKECGAKAMPNQTTALIKAHRKLDRIRDAIAGDRCDGDSDWAQGVNAACRRHLTMIDAILSQSPLADSKPRDVDQIIALIKDAIDYHDHNASGAEAMGMVEAERHHDQQRKALEALLAPSSTPSASTDSTINALRGLHKAVKQLADHFDKPITDENVPLWLALNSAQAHAEKVLAVADSTRRDG